MFTFDRRAFVAWLQRTPRNVPTAHSGTHSLSTLPPELILMILPSVATEDLFSLALTCRTLHFLALEHILQRYGVPHPRVEIRVHAAGTNALLLRALCMAIFLEGTRHFSWRAENSESWAKEVKHVVRFLSGRRYGVANAVSGDLAASPDAQSRVTTCSGASISVITMDATVAIDSVTLDFGRVLNLGRRREAVKMMSARLILPLVKIAGALVDLAAKKCAVVRVVNTGQLGWAKDQVAGSGLSSSLGGEDESGTVLEDAISQEPRVGPLSARIEGDEVENGNINKSISSTCRTYVVGSSSTTRRGGSSTPGGSQPCRGAAKVPLSFPRRLLQMEKRGGRYKVARLEVCDPNLLENPTGIAWLACWTRKAALECIDAGDC